MSHQSLKVCLALALLTVTLDSSSRAQEVAAPGATAPVPVIAAMPATEPEVSLDELLRRALADSPQLPVAQAHQEAAQQRLAALRSLPNPTLELVAGLGGSAEARDEEVLLSQPLDLFGQRRARAGVAAAELRRTQAEMTLAQRTLIVAVKNAAAELFAAQEAESLGQVQAGVARLFREAAARRAQLGDVPPVQVQRAELEVLRVENELTNAQAERLSRRAALNQLVGQEPQTPLRVVLPTLSSLTDLLQPPVSLSSAATNAPPSTAVAPQLPSTTPSSDNLAVQRDQILPGALINRPDVVSATAELATRRAQVEALRRARLPDVELQARRSAFFGRPGSYALRAVVTVPVFDFGSIKRERRAAEAEVRAQSATIKLLQSQAAMQVEQALIRLQQQRATVERYRTGIVPISVDLLRKTQIGYAAGASTYLEVLEAQRTLRQVQTEYLQALVGVRTGETALESALGAPLPADLSDTITNPTGPTPPPGVAAPGTVPPLTEKPQP